MNVDEQIISSIDNILQLKYDKEDALRSVFQLARHIAQNEISEMLADFRNKRALGKLLCFRHKFSTPLAEQETVAVAMSAALNNESSLGQLT